MNTLISHTEDSILPVRNFLEQELDITSDQIDKIIGHKVWEKLTQESFEIYGLISQFIICLLSILWESKVSIKDFINQREDFLWENISWKDILLSWDLEKLRKLVSFYNKIFN